MGLFEDFSNFLESRLEEFLASNPQLELQSLTQELKEQHQDTTKTINRLQLEEQRVEGEILQTAKDVQTWHRRIDKAKTAGRLDLAEEAEARVNNLLSQGNLLWQQMQQIKQNLSKSKELLISIEDKQKEVALKIAQLQASQTSTNSSSYSQTGSQTYSQSSNYEYDPLEDKFQQWELQQELDEMKRNL